MHKCCLLFLWVLRCQRNVTVDGIKGESLAGGQVSNDIININMISVGHWERRHFGHFGHRTNTVDNLLTPRQCQWRLATRHQTCYDRSQLSCHWIYLHYLWYLHSIIAVMHWPQPTVSMYVNTVLDIGMLELNLGKIHICSMNEVWAGH